jgi:hypothetical protein
MLHEHCYEPFQRARKPGVAEANGKPKTDPTPDMGLAPALGPSHERLGRRLRRTGSSTKSASSVRVGQRAGEDLLCDRED